MMAHRGAMTTKLNQSEPGPLWVVRYFRELACVRWKAERVRAEGMRHAFMYQKRRKVSRKRYKMVMPNYSPGHSPDRMPDCISNPLLKTTHLSGLLVVPWPDVPPPPLLQKVLPIGPHWLPRIFVAAQAASAAVILQVD